MSFIKTLRDKVLRENNKKARTKEAREWYKKLTKNILRQGRIPNKNNYDTSSELFTKEASTSRKVMNDSEFKKKSVNKIEVGKLYLYQYDAKYKDELPYWDAFPLALIVDERPEHFLTLNLHYIPPDYRLALLDELNTIKSDNRNRDTTKFISGRQDGKVELLTYQTLAKVTKSRYYAPCVKLHIKSRIQSSATLITPKYWDLVCFLPTELFVGAYKSKVWADSKKIISNFYS